MNYLNDYKIIDESLKDANSKKKKKDIIDNFELTKDIGFNNIGNTCYMNSFLQILLHIPTFLPILKKLYKNNIEKDTLIYNLIKLSENPSDNKFLYNIIYIISKTHPKYGQFSQNDSQIFAIDFLDSIISEIKKENSNVSSENKEESRELINEKECFNFKKEKFHKFISDCEEIGEKTFIEDLFLFYDSMFVYKNKSIDPKKIKFELLLNIELNFPVDKVKNNYTLYELLDNKYTNTTILCKFCSKQKKIEKNKDSFLQHDIAKEFYFLLRDVLKTLINSFIQNKIYEKTEEKSEPKKLNNSFSNKSLEIYKILSLPKILIISFIRGIEGKELINSSVTFTDIIDMKNYIDEDLFDIKLGTIYKLYAINIREGKTKSYGHYYSYIKIENNWICFNDNNTNHIKPKFCLDNVVGLYYIKTN